MNKNQATIQAVYLKLLTGIAALLSLSTTSWVPCSCLSSAFIVRPSFTYYYTTTTHRKSSVYFRRSSSSSSNLASSNPEQQQQKPEEEEEGIIIKKTKNTVWKSLWRRIKPQHPIVELTTIDELNLAFSKSLRNGDSVLKTTVVKGDTQKIGSPDMPDFIHPVVQLLHHRRRTTTTTETTTPNTDGFKVALAIEGGGMRGCVSAGMVAAIYYLDLQDTFDVVYGSSAGSLIGAYFITRQLPWFGPELYYDILTTAGKSFIDTRRLFRALGLGLLDPRLLWDVITRRNHGKPVLKLSFLLEEAVQRIKPLNWTKFVEMQQIQPLKVVASGLKSEKSIVFDMEKKSFTNLKELAFCMHASMLLPGIAGPVMNIGRNNNNNNTSDVDEPRMQQILKNTNSNNAVGSTMDDFEPLVDALLYEPLPYRSAVAEGASHVVVLRTRPDGVDVLGKPSIFERLIMRRFFLRKNYLPNIYRRMRKQEHKRLYAEDVIVLNNAVNDCREYKEATQKRPHLLPIAMPPNSQEIARLETGREEILQGVRRGFGRAYDALVEDPQERGRGMIVAKQCFPDIILDYNPMELMITNNNGTKEISAFEVYVRSSLKPDDADDFLSKAKGSSALEKQKQHMLYNLNL